MKHRILIAAAMVALTSPAFAQSQGDWTIGLGVANVNPQSGNGRLVDGTVPTDIGDSTRPIITGEYFIRDNIGIEVLGAWPFNHSIKSDGTEIGKVKSLPPVVSLQYHFNAGGQFKPFIGLGINFTNFYDSDGRGPLDSADLDVKDSWGVAAHVGADYWFSDNSAVRADLRWIDIESEVRLNGEKIGTVNVDPIVTGISYVRKF